MPRDENLDVKREALISQRDCPNLPQGWLRDEEDTSELCFPSCAQPGWERGRESTWEYYSSEHDSATLGSRMDSKPQWHCLSVANFQSR